MSRSMIVLTTVLSALSALAPEALASGAPSLAVQELTSKGMANPGPYLQALNLRGPMLATCFGSKEAMEASKPFEAFLEVGKDGLPQSVNLLTAHLQADADVDACLLKQLNKARFPQHDRVVEVKVMLGPAPKEEVPAE